MVPAVCRVAQWAAEFGACLMTWAKLDDSFPEHPKIAALSDAAFRQHVTAICYAAKFNTDGEITPAAFRMIRGSAKLAAQLVDATLWDALETGWAIHDFLEYNPSREKVTEKSTKRAAAGRLGGQQSAIVRGSKTEAKPEAIAQAKPKQLLHQNLNPVPTRPDPDDSYESSHQRGASLPPLLRDRANTLALAVGDRWVDEETWDSIVQLCEEFSDFEIEYAKRENRKVTPSRRPFPGNLREFLSKPNRASEPPKKSVNDLLAEQEESDRRWEERIKRDGVMPGGIPTDG